MFHKARYLWAAVPKRTAHRGNSRGVLPSAMVPWIWTQETPRLGAHMNDASEVLSRA